MALHYNAGNDLQLSIKMCKQHRERMGQRERKRGNKGPQDGKRYK